MTIDEAARYLFVSRTHVRLLLDKGILQGTVDEAGDLFVDDASVERHKGEVKRAAEAFFRLHAEDNDPLGL